MQVNGDFAGALVTPEGTIACYYGCCPGCQDCYGYSIGCHQRPCRCELPCTCRYREEDTDPGWRHGCARHDSAGDQRPDDPDREYVDLDPEDVADLGPCPECGATGACAYDADGRALIHVTPEDDES